jgi:hypothetical protein
MTYTTPVASFSTYAKAYDVAQAKRQAFFAARHEAAHDLAVFLTQWRGANWAPQLGQTRESDVGLHVDFFM